MQNNIYNQINEKDLEYIFSGKRPHRRNYVISTIKYTLLAILIFIVIFIGINYQAIFHKLNYWYQIDYKTDNKSSDNISTSSQKSFSDSLPNVAENHILIPKISVDAPITWNVVNNESDVRKSLENGAIHLEGTALPGTQGNVFITAHSSNYAWAPGHYKTLFSLLDKLSVGDKIYLRYQSKTYVYNVYEIKVVSPNDVSVLNQNNKSILTLMTCTPVGTSLNRLILSSNQITPSPSNNTPSFKSSSNSSLPQVR